MLKRKSSDLSLYHSIRQEEPDKLMKMNPVSQEVEYDDFLIYIAIVQFLLNSKCC